MGKKDTTEVFMTELDTYLFGQGTHYEIYNKMGAHLAVKDGEEGVYFVVWAPAAREGYVVGDFNSWNEAGYRMTPVSDGGVYEGVTVIDLVVAFHDNPFHDGGVYKSANVTSITVFPC